MKKILVMALSLISLSVMADFNIAQNGKIVTCYGEDNMSFALNAKRTTLKYTVEGESLGPKKITKMQTDNATYVSYKTSEGTLVLSDTEDTYQFAEDEEAFSVICK